MKVKLFLCFAVFALAPIESHATYGVASGNGSGISDVMDGGEPPLPPNPPSFDPPPDDDNNSNLPYGDLSLWALLPKPSLSRADRISMSSVHIEWKCGPIPPNTDGSARDLSIFQPRLVIRRQTQANDNWQEVHSVPLPNSGTDGTWTDGDAPVGPTYRYTAITTALWAGDTHASNASRDIYVEYHPAVVAMLGYRSGPGPYSATPPGGAISGNPEQIDKLSMSIGSLSDSPPVPALVNDETVAGQGQLVKANQVRHWDWPYETNTTSLAVGGYIVHGRPFAIAGHALIGRGEYGGATIDISSKTQAAWTGGFTLFQKHNTAPHYFAEFKGSFTPVSVPTLRYSGIEPQGFDNRTYFAAQHQPVGTFTNLQLRVDPSPGGPSIPITVTGPFTTDPADVLAQTDGSPLQLTATGIGAGKVKEMATSHELQAFSLEPRNWTIGIYRVNIVDTLGDTSYDAPTLPNLTALQDALNAIYGPQANVSFHLIPKGTITVSTTNFEPAEPIGYPWDADAGKMKKTCWNTASPDTDLAFFYVPEMTPGVLGQTFGIPSRGALCGPTGDIRTAAHELGHCLGLHHCWTNRLQNGGMSRVPDEMEKRIMGYGGGSLLRHAEIEELQRWSNAVSPLGPP